MQRTLSAKKNTASGSQRACPPPAPLTPGPLDMGLLVGSPRRKQLPPPCPIGPGWTPWSLGPLSPQHHLPNPCRSEEGGGGLADWAPQSAGQGGVGGQRLCQSPGEEGRAFSGVHSAARLFPARFQRPHVSPALTQPFPVYCLSPAASKLQGSSQQPSQSSPDGRLDAWTDEAGWLLSGWWVMLWSLLSVSLINPRAR